MTGRPRVAIIGGGLAGLATAVRLAEEEVDVELFEARRQLGGRAGSYVDRESGEIIDHCQHVALGCCTEFLSYCRRTATIDEWQRHDVLHFFSPDGRQYDLRPTWGLPAPLHLAWSLARLGFLTWNERWQIARCLARLVRAPVPTGTDEPTVGQWLRTQGQTDRMIARFWSVVLISALSEAPEVVALSAAKKVFSDAFLTSRDGASVWTARRPLNEIHERVGEWLAQRKVNIRRATAIRRLLGTPSQIRRVLLAREDESTWTSRASSHDAFVLAVPWHRIRGLFGDTWPLTAPHPDTFLAFRPAAIASLHLWFDRPLSPLPHAVLVERLTQWVFRGPVASREPRGATAEWYYQVVISAAHSLADRPREEILREVLADLRAIWPIAVGARLRRWQMLTEPRAVFSPRPGLDAIRPGPQTSCTNLFLAGDWTNTGWPATMESAVRSGQQAAEAVLAFLGSLAARPRGAP